MANIYSKEIVYFPATSEAGLENWRYDNSTIPGKVLLFNYTGATYPNPLIVPQAKGSAIINDWTDATNSGTTDTNRNTPFYNNPNIVNVDLQEVPFRNNSMYNAFYNCRNLISVSNIPNSVTSMYRTFFSCHNLNQNIQIPNSVTNMYSTFYWCNSLNQNIQIPNSVTNMYGTFFSCRNLNQNIQIPNGVTDMASTFAGCYNLNQNIQIPNSVINMADAFEYCSNLNQNIQIPSSVTNMKFAFPYCNNLNSWINILSSEVSDATDVFYRNNASASIPNVIIQSRYVDNTLTPTYNSLKSAGWTMAVTGKGAEIGSAGSKIKAWDFIGGDWTFYGDGANWQLRKWGGELSTALNDGVTATDINIPRTFAGYPVVVNYAALSGNRSITSVDFNGTTFVTNGANIFLNCNAVTTVKNLPVSTSFYDAFGSSPAGVFSSISDTGAIYQNEAHVTFDNSAMEIRAMFSNCKGIKKFYINGGWNANNVNTVNMFRMCNTQPIEVYFDCPGIHFYQSIFYSNNTSFRKDVYIYFKYNNGTDSYSYTTAASNVQLTGTFKNSEIMYNSTSNIYIHNRGICPYV